MNIKSRNSTEKARGVFGRCGPAFPPEKSLFSGARFCFAPDREHHHHRQTDRQKDRQTDRQAGTHIVAYVKCSTHTRTTDRQKKRQT